MRMVRRPVKTTEPALEEFRARLRKLRIQKNLSQAELASKLGLSTLIVSRYERGVTRPSSDTLMKLAEVLDVTADYLLEGVLEGAARANFADRKLLKLFQEIDSLPQKDKEFIGQVIDELLTTRRIRAMTAS